MPPRPSSTVFHNLPRKESSYAEAGRPADSRDRRAETLLARDAADLQSKFRDRELAQCPPVLEETQRQRQILKLFSYPAGRERRTPHYAAVFGPTRWTNLYFPNRLLLWGDLIGGPVRDIFGAGVKDVPVQTSLRSGLLGHTLYWAPKPGQNPHLAALRAALDLLDTRR